VDANNLYGNALSCPLPQRNFKWEENHKEILSSLPSINWRNSKIGYVLEVDLHLPPHLHDKYDDLPLAPERSEIADHWKPQFMKDDPSSIQM
jgi:hypothetical protein